MQIPVEWHSHFNILIFDHIDSTNAEAKRVAKIFRDGEFLIWAYMQSAGKGRNGNKWISPKNNLYLSLLLRPKQESFELLSYLPFVTALAIGDYVAKKIQNTSLLKYKWPNDILYDNKKIAGILIETKIKSTQKIDWVILGCGLNLVESPNNLQYPTISLKDIISKDIKVEDAIDDIMRLLSHYTQILNQKGFIPIRDLWLQRAFGVGKTITVSTPNNRLFGVFEDIDENGAILLRLSNGEVVRIMSGEVFVETEKQLFNFPLQLT